MLLRPVDVDVSVTLKNLNFKGSSLPVSLSSVVAKISKLIKPYQIKLVRSFPDEKDSTKSQLYTKY